MSNDSLGDRCKSYEKVFKNHLTSRTPIIIRVDGRSFHSYTRPFDRPFDDDLSYAMREAATYVAQDMQNFKMFYTQSDEVSFLLYDNNIESETWFGNNLSKVCSIAASRMTAKFNSIIYHTNKTARLAEFDARAFNIPETDISNYFLWRMKDNYRNSVNAYARKFLSHKNMHGKKIDEIKKELNDMDKPWDQIKPIYKFGLLLVNNNGLTDHYVEPYYDNINNIVKEVLESEV